jgi:opacity protein-like surface antigen
LTLSGQAQFYDAPFSRSGRFELFGVGQYSAAGSGDEVELDVDGFSVPVTYGAYWGGGLGVGYNFTDHWNLNFTFTGGSVEARTQLNGASGPALESTALALSWSVQMDYNFLADPFTPLLTVGLTVDDFADTVASRAGFIRELDYFQSMIGLGGGAGVRWELSDHWFLKAVYRGYYRFGLVDLEGEEFVHGAVVSLGYQF